MKERIPFRRRPISVQLRVFAGAVLAAILVVFLTAYVTIFQSLNEQNVAYTSQILTQTAESIENSTDTLQVILQTIGYDKMLANLLYQEDAAARYEAYSQITPLVRRLESYSQDIRFFFCIGANGKVYYSAGKRTAYDELFSDLPRSNGTRFLFFKQVPLEPDNLTDAFVIYAPLYDLWNTTKSYYLGQIALLVDEDYLGITDFRGSYGMGLYLLDENGVLQCRNRVNDIPESTQQDILDRCASIETGEPTQIRSGGTVYLVNRTELPSLSCSLLSVMPRRAIYEEVTWLRVILIWMSVTLILVMLILFRLTSRVLTKPLNEFSAFLQQNAKQSIRLTGSAEIEKISAEYNRMLLRENALTQELVQAQKTIYQTELAKKQAELLWLKSRLDPHFLYNTLETGIGLAYMEDAERTAQTLKQLSMILRYSVKGDQKVPLRQEMEMVRAYTEIQRTRFSGAFEVVFDIEESVLNARLPKMVLQPLVENAIVHGLEPKGSGHLRISGSWEDEEQLCLCVEDDGIGIDSEQLHEIRAALEQGGENPSGGIGLVNVAERLRLTCGEVRFHVEAGMGEGCRVKMIIPADRS